MTPPPKTGVAERQRLAEIIDQLKDDGWLVTPGPPASQIPTPLRDYQVDFIAVRGADILIGEVVSQRNATKKRTEELAKIVKGIPNAQFQVYWIGDEDAEEPSVSQIRRYLRESRAIAAQSPQASLLMAMAAFEAGLRVYAESVEAEVPGTPRSIFEHLFSLGLVSAPDHTLLLQLYKLRSGIAHGVSSEIPRPDDIAAVRSIAERMGTGKYVSIGIMTDWLSDYLLDAGESILFGPDETLPRNRVNELVRLLGREFPSASARDRHEAVRNLRYTPAATES